MVNSESSEKLTLSVSEDGVIISPNLHDSNLAGIMLGKNIKLIFLLETGEEVALQLQDVEGFVGSELRQGNKVLDIAFLHGSNADFRFLPRIFGHPSNKTKFDAYLETVK